MRFALSIVIVAFATLASEEQQEDSPADAIKSMHELIVKMDYETLYTEHFHKNVQSQLSKARFIRFMGSDDGQSFALLFKNVNTAIIDSAGEDVLIAREQDMPDTYEFIIVAAERTGRNWHLELAKEDGRWKLKDFD